ncbi:acetyl-coenzyme A synthetase [Alphaproteobacteria bacterium]|nr:acetyl-coenzyme A synthetase [Alphaproteobacteria bacterium]
MLFGHELAWKEQDIYDEIYENSIQNFNEFWAFHSKDIAFSRQPSSIFDKATGKWLSGAAGNICYNCVDKHAIATPKKPAIIWHGDLPGERELVTYSELLNKICSISSILRLSGIKKGDVVAIYMPMVPDAIAAMLACARIGAIHLTIFAGFSPSALAYRIEMSNAKILLTYKKASRSGKTIDLLGNCQKALSEIKGKTPKILVLDDEDIYLNVSINRDVVECDSDDNLFILYTSGSSGKPKGIIHSGLPFLLYAATTFKFIFDAKSDDVYFCTSDIGWITGHSYIAYAPLFQGLSIVIFEGNPTYPSPDRYWDIIENESVTLFYTSPTALRTLQAFDENYIKSRDLSSLRILGSVGEPIDEKTWNWFFEAVGKRRCPIVDTWWQTETGGIILAPLLDLKRQKPCVVGKPFFGIAPKIIDAKDEFSLGRLTITNKWPGMCSSILYECPEDIGACVNIFNKNYLKDGLFLTGDGAFYDTDFDIKVTGRLDDVLNISGHRLSSAEFEDAINKVRGVKECAIVPVAHEIKGQAAFAYVVKSDNVSDEELRNEIASALRSGIGPIARPDFIAFVHDLPKTRSGKILRYLLKDIAANKQCTIKDLSSLCNKESIDNIMAETRRCLNGI